MAGATGAAFRARRASGSAALKLLRAENMPVIAATCGRHLVEQRVLPYPEFVTLVAEDLAELRDDGFALPRTAQEYIADWIRDAILIRRATAAREETVELSPSAADTIGFIASIDQPRASVTSSRLANVSELLSTLARDTDPDPAHLVEALRRERDRIDQQIARVEQQGYVPLDDASAQERLAEVLRLADEVPRDFAKVAGSLEQLNQSLREQIVNHDGQRGGVLAEVFSGVDVIENSDAGRSFNAFYRLLLDPELIEGFDAAVDAVLQREFTNELPLAESAFLRQYLTTLQRESAQVRGTLTDLSRSLRRFVETQEYREHKRLADAIGRAEQVAMAVLRELPATHPLGLGLDLTSMTISSIGGWTLHNPADVRTSEQITEHLTAPLDVEQMRELVRVTEIDFPELQRNVAATLAGQPGPTVGDVLARFPATQGLASVVGLLVLALEHAVPAAGCETWAWHPVTSSQTRTVSAPRYVFGEVPADWSQR